jgi:hypothetical protein
MRRIRRPRAASGPGCIHAAAPAHRELLASAPLAPPRPCARFPPAGGRASCRDRRLAQGSTNQRPHHACQPLLAGIPGVGTPAHPGGAPGRWRGLQRGGAGVAAAALAVAGLGHAAADRRRVGDRLPQGLREVPVERGPDGLLLPEGRRRPGRRQRAAQGQTGRCASSRWATGAGAASAAGA